MYQHYHKGHRKRPPRVRTGPQVQRACVRAPTTAPFLTRTRSTINKVPANRRAYGRKGRQQIVVAYHAILTWKPPLHAFPAHCRRQFPSCHSRTNGRATSDVLVSASGARSRRVLTLMTSARRWRFCGVFLVAFEQKPYLEGVTSSFFASVLGATGAGLCGVVGSLRPSTWWVVGVLRASSATPWTELEPAARSTLAHPRTRPQQPMQPRLNSPLPRCACNRCKKPPSADLIIVKTRRDRSPAAGHEGM